MRIAVLPFSHETVTFLPNDTTLDDFLYPGSPAAGEALLGSDPKGYTGGFVQVARECDGVELVGIGSPLRPRTGTGSGWITTEAFETFLGRMVAQLRAQGRFDGAYLALHGSTTMHRIPAGVALARQAVAEGRAPVVLADHSDRSGYATWLLREIVAQGLSRTLVATIAAPQAIGTLAARGAKPGDPFDMEIGGRVDPSAGDPVRITGRVLAIADASTKRAQGRGQTWVCVAFGEGNVVVLSPFLVQIMHPEELWALGLSAADYDVIAIKSRVHFRRGFDDSGFAPTILLVEPDEPFLGTVQLEALPYRNLNLRDFHPYGGPADPFA